MGRYEELAVANLQSIGTALERIADTLDDYMDMSLVCRRHWQKMRLVCGVWSCSGCFEELMERENAAAPRRAPGVAVMDHKRVRRVDRDG